MERAERGPCGLLRANHPRTSIVPNRFFVRATNQNLAELRAARSRSLSNPGSGMGDDRVEIRSAKKCVLLVPGGAVGQSSASRGGKLQLDRLPNVQEFTVSACPEILRSPNVARIGGNRRPHLFRWSTELSSTRGLVGKGKSLRARGVPSWEIIPRSKPVRLLEEGTAPPQRQKSTNDRDVLHTCMLTSSDGVALSYSPFFFPVLTSRTLLINNKPAASSPTERKGKGARGFLIGQERKGKQFSDWPTIFERKF